METERIRFLLEQQLERELTNAEQAELTVLCDTHGNEVITVIAALISREANIPAPLEKDASDMLFHRILQSDQVRHTAPRTRYLLSPFRLAAAAAVIILLATATWLLFRPNETKLQAVKNQASSIVPGHDGAILTLADGRQIILDTLSNGSIATGESHTIQLSNNQLIYSNSPGNPASEKYPSVNRLSTPRGRQYRLSLPDGTGVWLNAASSISFPVAFTGAERLVELSGEAFFEVAQQVSQPFIVKMKDTRVTVLGTGFNCMAYPEEAQWQTTLVSGAVKVERAGEGALLKPGQQAQIGKVLSVNDHADLEEVLAWKEGRFLFGDNTNIQTIMRQVSNWYDVEVVYHGTINTHIGGSLSRNVSLSELLKVLEATGVVRCKVEDRVIHVYPT